MASAYQRFSQARTGMAARWRGLPGVTRGALWMIASSVLFVCMGAMVKVLGATYHPLQVAFVRALIGVMILLPLILHLRPQALRTGRPWLHLLRGLLGACAMMSGFFALTHLPLADVTAISFSRILFFVPLALLILRENIGLYRLSATVVGFAGVLIILRPSGTTDPAALLAVANALFVAMAVTCVKVLSRTEHALSMMFSTALIGTVVTAGPGLYLWQMPTWNDALLMIAMGLVGAAANNCFVRGFSEPGADAMALTPIDYTRIVFSAILGYVLFSDVPDLWTILGALIIVASTLFITYRESVKAQEREARVKPAPVEPG